MIFTPNYKTEDEVFEVMLDKNILSPVHPETRYGFVTKEITNTPKIWVYNTETRALSQKSIYYDEKKGFYFKAKWNYWNTATYRIDDLVEIKESKHERD